jgi:lon-related putative ATP-dependent protease
MSSNGSPKPLAPECLGIRVDPDGIPADAAAFDAFQGLLGHQRAQAALAFGVAMAAPGYNIYVMGEPGTGRRYLAVTALSVHAHERGTPRDWLYLPNFDEVREPRALALPAGMGKGFLARVESLIDRLLGSIPAVFESPAYQRRKAVIERDFNGQYDRVVRQLERHASEKGVAVFREGDDISFGPMLGGQSVSEEEFAGFPDSEKTAFHENAQALETFLVDALVDLPRWKREAAECLERLGRETVDGELEELFQPLSEIHADQPGILAFFSAMRLKLLSSGAEHLLQERGGERRRDSDSRAALLAEYAPHLLVSHVSDAGAPVIFESNPTYGNLFGRIEYLNEQGNLVTNHRQIRPGAIHRANGGFLILEAEKLAADPQAWSALKRALQNRYIRMEPANPDLAAATTMSLDPEAIPLDLKLVLIGTRELYYLLQDLDPEFNELFQVLADFDDFLPRDRPTIAKLLSLVRQHGEEHGRGPMTAEASAALIEHAIRLAEHRQRLSPRVGELLGLAGEADYLRRIEGAERIERRHVDQALRARDQRLGRIRDRLFEESLEGRIIIQTEGQAVGRINGLTVMEIGDCRFGSPARITATVFPGGRGVVDIEREARLGQSIHSKGVMILAGYLGQRYARHFPLAISANIALEQSYGYVDGDSASLAELCALISALSGLPIAQSLAVTGSINQYGEVQAVGGVNEKIEGFFRLCQARGLSGTQGVIIPAANVLNLVLHPDLAEAARTGALSVFPVSTVDAALELLTGRSARVFNRLAVRRLKALSALHKRAE